MSLRSRLWGLPKATLMTLVKGYRLLLSPSLGSGCRFEPTCSAYALDALQQHGATAGSYLTLRRLARCHPWCAGGHDPVPEHLRSLFSFLPASAPSSTRIGKFRLFNRLVTPVAAFLFKKKLS